ncbi:hypothetical protein ACYFX5_23160 [Bremerella sp. T1]|uniref:hypothetical protein n=1 Tax=Bremerella sp. TYQ1 TaxID=3119568 RepID=UPI001CCE80C7|nr:hypothetical protein [Bremerella volcania]UBM35933.1 hypothetical protein LA756_25105 [Bremerella volcania]
MKKLLTLLASISLLANVGCSMCSHPFDYNYAAYDEAQMSGHRAGSAFAPYSTQSVITESAPVEVEGEVIEEEVIYYDESQS